MQKDNVPYGSDISAGRYACADCGHEYSGPSRKSMPPCPYYQPSTHSLNGWKVLTGQGDAVEDHYPNNANK